METSHLRSNQVSPTHSKMSSQSCHWARLRGNWSSYPIPVIMWSSTFWKLSKTMRQSQLKPSLVCERLSMALPVSASRMRDEWSSSFWKVSVPSTIAPMIMSSLQLIFKSTLRHWEQKWIHMKIAISTFFTEVFREVTSKTSPVTIWQPTYRITRFIWANKRSKLLWMWLQIKVPTKWSISRPSNSKLPLSSLNPKTLWTSAW